MTFIDFTCPTCNIPSKKYIGHYNRSTSIGAPVYCSRECAGVGRRKTIEEKKRVKAEYDKKIAKTPERKQKQHEYFVKDYKANPEKYKKERQRRYAEHLKYLQRPDYKEWKKNYDEQYLAKKHYGDFAEAAIVLKRIENELDSQQIKLDTGITFNKSSKQRKRQWQQLNKILQSKS